MKHYLIQILTFSLLCSLIEHLTPAGEREGLRRAVRLLTALCMLCLMIAPLREAGDFFTSFDLGAWARETEQQSQARYEALMEQKLTAVTREQLRAELLTMLSEQFDIGADDCTLTVEFDDGESTEGVTVRQVWISLHGKAVLRDPRAVEAAVTSALGCPCTVSVG